MAERNLTRKQEKFVEKYIETGIGTQAAKEAYPDTTYDTQRQIASENLTKPHIVKAIEEALPDDLLAKVHLEGLFATKPVFSAKGELIAEDADFNVRHKYLDSAYKIKGKYAPDKSITVNVDVDSSEDIKSLAARLNAMERGTGVTGDGAISSPVGEEAQD